MLIARASALISSRRRANGVAFFWSMLSGLGVHSSTSFSSIFGSPHSHTPISAFRMSHRVSRSSPSPIQGAIPEREIAPVKSSMASRVQRRFDFTLSPARWCRTRRPHSKPAPV